MSNKKKAKEENLERGKDRAEEKTKEANARAEQIKKVSKVFTRKMLDLGDELQDIIIESQDEIVEAVVQHIMKYNSSPEQVLGSIIEEIKYNKTQVLRDGTIDTELIENGVESLSQGSLLSSVNVSQGASAGIGRR